MSDPYFQPPLFPGMGTNGANPMAGNYGANANPFYSIGNQFLPRNLNDIIKWSKYIVMQSPIIGEVLRKLSTYPITGFDVDTQSAEVKRKYEEIFESFNLEQTLHNIGFEFYSLGNVFISIYYPIQRFLVCPRCESLTSAKSQQNLIFREYSFKGSCPACKAGVTFKVMDKKSTSVEDMNIIKWDPSTIVVNHNPITNESEFYYKIPADIRKRIMRGDRLLVDTIPWSMIESVKNNQDFKFNKGSIFHLKNISASHMVNGIAVPPVISLFSLVFYQASLRKANESVASDFMSPMRVIFPQPQTANSDPVVSLSMENFAARMQEAMINHKRDKNHVLIAPVPIGYEAISGEGKALLVSQEIMQAEETILLSLGVSRELLSGTTNWTSSTVGLRLLENNLKCFTSQINKLLAWIMSNAARYLTLPQATVTLIPFKLMDDESFRSVIGNLSGANKASLTTLFESFGQDYEEELKRMEEEAVQVAMSAIRTKGKVEKAQFLAAKQAGSDLGEDGDYKANLEKAQATAEQFIAMDDGARRVSLNQLKVQDYATYLMVSKLVEEYMESPARQQELAAQVDNANGNPGEPTTQAEKQPGQLDTPQGGGGVQEPLPTNAVGLQAPEAQTPQPSAPKKQEAKKDDKKSEPKKDEKK